MKLLINLQYDFEYRGFVADCPSLPGCMSQGKTKTEAIKNIREAIQGYIKVLRAKLTVNEFLKLKRKKK